MSIELVMPSNYFILCHPLLLPSSIFPSIRVFSNESTLRIRRPKYWSFSFNITPSDEHPGLISFRMDWLDLLAVQGTLKTPLQHHSWKASIFRRSAFFLVQLSQPIERARGRRERWQENERKKSEMVRDWEKQVYLLNMWHSQEKTKNIFQYALCSILVCVNSIIKLAFTLYVILCQRWFLKTQLSR